MFGCCCVRVRVGCKAGCRQKFEPVPVLELVHAMVPISFGKNPGARRSVEQHAGQKQPKCPSSNAAFRASGFENGRQCRSESLSDAAFQEWRWPLEEKTFLLEQCF